jgi:hypothetical protein
VRKCYDVVTRIHKSEMGTSFRDIRPFPTAAAI